MTGIPHTAIVASAGSGKTFQLAHRYIRLLASGVKPERIIALTFSRKAAGEMFDAMVEHLAEAGATDRGAQRAAARIGRPGYARTDFLRLLRDILRSIHRLHIGTLDSFTVGIVRAFPMELGVAMDFDVQDNESAAARELREDVLAEIFRPRGADRRAQDEFLEAFKQATFGQEVKGFGGNLERFLASFQKEYRALPRAESWGHEPAIWGAEAAPWWRRAVNIGRVAADLEAWVRAAGWKAEPTERWLTYLEAVRDYSPTASWTDRLEYLFEKLCGVRGDLEQGHAVVKLNRTEIPLGPAPCPLALDTLAHVVQIEIQKAMTSSQGLFRILRLYEGFYDQETRRSGHFTFEDAQYFLAAPGREHAWGARLSIDYRMDARLDHWLLDEFQDTSNLQWAVLSNLADEILQDHSGQRSFFYVGDVKQAIYGWRGGNARLFDQILQRYRGRIAAEPLHVSYRCNRPIIEVVNRVFGDIPARDFPARARAHWENAWQKHESRNEAGAESGFVGIIEPPSNQGSEKPGDEDRYRGVACLLREVEPLRRGLSVAVLVRSNDAGRDVVDTLRRACPELPVVHEGNAPLLDNPVVSLLLSLLQWSAHPGDLFARRHLEMSPLLKHLTAETFPLAVLRQVQAEGFQATLRFWGGALERAGGLDGFGSYRLDSLLEAAGEFDRSGSRDCDRFIRSVKAHEIREAEAGQSIRVMTVHQSKGLGFDLVILPDLQPRNGTMNKAGRVDFHLARDEQTDAPRWALLMPRRPVAEQDAVLAAELERADADAAFEALCVLYVAMTRAKQALYLVTSFPGKSSVALTPAAFVKQRLLGDPPPVDGDPVSLGGEPSRLLFAEGKMDWYKTVEVETDAGEKSLPRKRRSMPARARTPPAVAPSLLAEKTRSAASLFSPASRDGLVLGTAVHALFSRVTWSDEVDIGTLLPETARVLGWPASFQEHVERHLRAVLSSREARAVWERPSGPVEVWREQAFDLILDGAWTTGVFDRVAIFRAPNGTVERATVFDYKTNDIANDDQMRETVAGYRPQLERYRRVLSALLHVPPERIDLRLLLTSIGRLVAL